MVIFSEVTEKSALNAGTYILDSEISNCARLGGHVSDIAEILSVLVVTEASSSQLSSQVKFIATLCSRYQNSK